MYGPNPTLLISNSDTRLGKTEGRRDRENGAMACKSKSTHTRRAGDRVHAVEPHRGAGELERPKRSKAS